MIKMLVRSLIYIACSIQTIFGLSLGKAAVIDFQIEKKSEVSNTLGKYAGTRFSAEIGKFFNLVDRERVKRVQEEMGIREPFTISLIGRLGMELNTQTVFIGKISQLNLKKSELIGNEAKVQLEIEVVDSVSGKIIDSCSITASSCPGGAKDQVYEEAVSHGCYELAKKLMMQYQPSATIQNLIGNKAVINIGSREGYKIGQELIVYRGKIFVGMAKITSLENLYAEISPIEGLTGLSTGDMVRAISVHISNSASKKLSKNSS